MDTVGSVWQEEELSGLKLVVGGTNLQAEITNINIIDNPNSYDWLSPGDLLLTMGYFCRDDEEMQRQLIRELSELNCVGLAIKTRRYLDVIPEAMLEEAERLGFPLIEIPVQYPLSKICKVVFERLSGGGVEKADRFVSLYHSITESMLEPQGTVHINVEEALASLPQEEQDDFPDLRIPEIYARAKYVPSSSQKWAEKAARDVEDDWEGFDPENEDWMEEEEPSHPAVSLVIGIILLISVLLALYSYFTSDLAGGSGLTAGSMM